MADFSTTALETPADHVRILHAEARTGAVAIAERPGGRWFERAISLRSLPAYVAALPADVDAYQSQGRFGGRRRIAHLITIGAAWTDLDVHRVEELSRLSDEAIVAMVLARCDMERIPIPSYIMSTGQGMAATWLHEPIPRRALPVWQAVQVGIHERMAGLGPDPAARDAARVLRLAGSRHTFAGRVVRCVYPAVGEPHRYGFDELVTAFAPFRSERAADQVRRRPWQPVARLRLAAHDGRRTDDGSWSLWGRRLDDIQALRAIRWEGSLPPHHRDVWLFVGAIAVSWMVPGVERVLLREILDLGREALGGSWTDRSIETSMGSVVRRAVDAARGRLIEWPPESGVMVDPRYRMRDATIIERLAITDDELAALPASGQLGSASLAARQAARGRMSGESRRSANAERDETIRSQQARGWAIAQIAREHGIARSTVRDVLGHEGGGR